jgi:hypothetical protein
MADIESTDYDRDVFLNVPFGRYYQPIRDGITFAVLACGLRPRSVMEFSNSAATRFDRLRGLIRDCRWGIHDLSHPADGPMRSNVALELGLFLGAATYGDSRQRHKASLILDQADYGSQRHFSDLSATNVISHGGDPEQAIRAVRDWVANEVRLADRWRIPEQLGIVEEYRRFQDDLPRICQYLNVSRDHLTVADADTLMADWLLARSGPRRQPAERRPVARPGHEASGVPEATIRGAVREFVTELSPEEREARALVPGQRTTQADT